MGPPVGGEAGVDVPLVGVGVPDLGLAFEAEHQGDLDAVGVKDLGLK